MPRDIFSAGQSLWRSFTAFFHLKPDMADQIMRVLIARQLRDRYLCIPLNRQSEFIEAISGN